MYVVTVCFTLKTESIGVFLPLMRENARLSLELEPGCHYFDVCQDSSRPELLFLYELYTDRAAFEAHLAAPHFKRFDAEVSSMVAEKSVRIYERLAV